MDFTRLEHHLLNQTYQEADVLSILAGHIDQAELDGQTDDHWQTRLGRPRPNSIGLSALLMLASAFGDEDTFSAAREPGTLALLQVADPEWIAPVAKAYEFAVRPHGKISTEIRVNASSSWADKSSQFVLATRTPFYGYLDRYADKTREPIPQEHVVSALAMRVPVLLVYADGEEAVTPHLASSIDHSFHLTPPSADVVRKLLHVFASAVPDGNTAEIPGLLPTHISVAFRKRTEPEIILAQLESFVAKPEAVSKPLPAQLNSLNGMPELRAWAENVRVDIEAYRSGTLNLAELPRGVLVEGPPGVGKTRSAHEIAKYLGTPIVYGSVARWLTTGSGHLGTLLNAMRSAFKAASSQTPCLLVIDEIDAFPQRGDDRRFWDAAIAGLLEALDGLETRSGVVVMGLCNNVGKLDPALRRAGRFDQTLTLGLPTIPELVLIIRDCVYPDLPDVDLLSIAIKSAGATIADIDRIVKDARRIARRSARPLEAADLLQVIAADVGETSEDVRERVAIHEAGHALIGHMERLQVRDVVLGNSRFGDGMTGWVNTTLPMWPGTIENLESYGRFLMAGRAAEIAVLGSASLGARGDIKTASELFETAFGEAALGTNLRWRHQGDHRMLGSQDFAKEVEAMLRKCHTGALELLQQNIVTLLRIKDALLAGGYLDATTLKPILAEANRIEVGEP